MNNEEKILALLEKMDKRLETLESGQTKLELQHELITEKTLTAINDGMANINEKFNRLDNVENKTEDHDQRIFALEQIVGA